MTCLDIQQMKPCDVVRDQDDCEPVTCCFPRCLVYCSQEPHTEWAFAPSLRLNENRNDAHYRQDHFIAAPGLVWPRQPQKVACSGAKMCIYAFASWWHKYCSIYTLHRWWIYFPRFLFRTHTGTFLSICVNHLSLSPPNITSSASPWPCRQCLESVGGTWTHRGPWTHHTTCFLPSATLAAEAS